jgi:hypothetical protein
MQLLCKKNVYKRLFSICWLLLYLHYVSLQWILWVSIFEPRLLPRSLLCYEPSCSRTLPPISPHFPVSLHPFSTISMLESNLTDSVADPTVPRHIIEMDFFICMTKIGSWAPYKVYKNGLRPSFTNTEGGKGWNWIWCPPICQKSAKNIKENIKNCHRLSMYTTCIEKNHTCVLPDSRYRIFDAGSHMMRSVHINSFLAA